MRSRVFIFLLCVFAFACVMKDSRPELEKNLKTAMQTFLYNTINNDSSNVKYHVEGVVYYDDPRTNTYICDFTVNMKTNQIGNQKYHLNLPQIFRFGPGALDPSSFTTSFGVLNP